MDATCKASATAAASAQTARPEQPPAKVEPRGGAAVAPVTEEAAFQAAGIEERSREIAKQIHSAVVGPDPELLRLDPDAFLEVLRSCNKKQLEAADRILRVKPFGYGVEQAIEFFDKAPALSARIGRIGLRRKFDEIMGSKSENPAAEAPGYVEPTVSDMQFMDGCRIAFERFDALKMETSSALLKELADFSGRFQRRENRVFLEMAHVDGAAVRTKLYAFSSEQRERVLGEVVQKIQDRTSLFGIPDGEEMAVWACCRDTGAQVQSAPEEILEHLARDGSLPESADEAYRTRLAESICRPNLKTLKKFLGIAVVTSAVAVASGVSIGTALTGFAVSAGIGWYLARRIDKFRNPVSPVCGLAAGWAFADHFSLGLPVFSSSKEDAARSIEKKLSALGCSVPHAGVRHCLSLLGDLITLGAPETEIVSTARCDDFDPISGGFPALEELRAKTLNSLGLTDPRRAQAVISALNSKARIERLMEQRAAQKIALSELGLRHEESLPESSGVPG